MAVFETLRIRAGRPEFWKAHMQRLTNAAEACGFAITPGALDSAAALFPLEERDGVARIYVTAGDGGPADPAHASRIAVLFEERSRELPESYFLVEHPAPHLPPFGGLKTANYWMNAESLRRAHAAGANEALLFAPGNSLIGACMGNVFLKTNGAWLTPSLESGARRGVVREWVLHALGAREARIPREDLQHCSAMLLTSSWLGAMPVRGVGEKKLETASPDIVQLRTDWARFTKEMASKS
jgi:branched-subunit amino acid aminotransferase/4-amino-4-deoxychorismate lyase